MRKAKQTGPERAQNGTTEMQIKTACLESADAQVRILSLGATTQSWRLADGRAMILGYDTPEAYQSNPNYLGSLVGRVSNRIAHGRFDLSGQKVQLPCNASPHHLHGGPTGLAFQNWSLDTDSPNNRVELRLTSPHGQGGYPGQVKFRVQISLTGAKLCYEVWAQVDRPTPISVAQHNYYHLAEPAPQTRLWLAADQVLPTDSSGLPRIEATPVAGGDYDFRTLRPMGRLGHDAHLILPQPGLAAHAIGADCQLRLWTTEPGLQLYTGAHLSAGFPAYHGFCLEPQRAPNAVNTAPDQVVATPEAPYHQRTEVEITPDPAPQPAI